MLAGTVSAGTVQEEFMGEVRRTVELKYILYVPEGYHESSNRLTTYPLILFLHGAGERGADLSKVKDLGPLRYAREHARGFPFLVVAPQSPLGKQWQSDALVALLDNVMKKYRVNPAAVYLTGYSMGGAGTWALAMDYPDRFAAIAPLCGRVIPLLAGNLWCTPIWVFHGDKDEVVPFSQSKEMVEILKGRGNDKVKLSVLAGRGHEIWTEVYARSELYAWFMEHRRAPGEKETEAGGTGRRPD
jgi:predicted peptidase